MYPVLGRIARCRVIRTQEPAAMRHIRTSLLTIVLVLLSASAWAQTSVAFFLTPKTTITDPITATVPKYTTPGALGVGLDITGWTGMDYGLESVFLVSAQLT